MAHDIHGVFTSNSQAKIGGLVTQHIPTCSISSPGQKKRGYSGHDPQVELVFSAQLSDGRAGYEYFSLDELDLNQHLTRDQEQKHKRRQDSYIYREKRRLLYNLTDAVQLDAKHPCKDWRHQLLGNGGNEDCTVLHRIVVKLST